MENIEMWIDQIFENTLPKQVVAIAFNLYEDLNNQWTIEMVGTASFDPLDPDWACDEIFDTRNNSLSWTQEANWEEILEQVVHHIKEYLTNGKYAKQLQSYQGIGVGFVEGDIVII